MAHQTILRSDGIGGCMALIGLALGCANRAVDLGGGAVEQEISRPSRCLASPIIDGNVLVTNQADVAALEGCEEIRGELAIQFYPDADLTALHSLRSVDAALVIGGSEYRFLAPDEAPEVEQLDQIDQREAALRGTWLSSLEGLESLTRVGELVIDSTAIIDLTPLQQLQLIGGSSISSTERTIPGDRFVQSGLSIQRNPNLLALTGLENARGVTSITITENKSLASLSGLSLSPNLDQISIAECPALNDIDALETVKTVSSVFLDELAVTDLDALSGLEEASDGINLVANAALVDASALSGLISASSIAFMGNPALTILPTLTHLSDMPEALFFADNDALEAIDIDPGTAFGRAFNFADTGRTRSLAIIQIDGNANLRSVILHESPVGEFGLIAAEVVSVYDNPNLASVDLGGLQRIDMLTISENPRLAQVTSPDLTRVGTLQVIDNASLSTAAFANLQTFESTFGGNADEPAP